MSLDVLAAMFGAVAFVLLLVSLGCMRIADWHGHEADYWYDVAWRVRIDPTQESEYRPILDWSQANPPSIWIRLRGWQSPRVRRLDVTGLG